MHPPGGRTLIVLILNLSAPLSSGLVPRPDKRGVAINNETSETIEFPSITSAAKYLTVDESYVRSCIKKKNKPCKGHTIVRKSANAE
jgi:NUMOD1 domain